MAPATNVNGKQHFLVGGVPQRFSTSLQPMHFLLAVVVSCQPDPPLTAAQAWLRVSIAGNESEECDQ
jgi:hypothetical protein